MPKYSIIIPCYNSENYIGRCLDALENQKNKDFEVILINDNSNDSTEEVINLYMNKSKMKIQYYKNKYNIGPGATRNVGIKIAKGEYIAFCDADDWYADNYLYEINNEIEQNHSDIVFCGYKQVFDNSKKVNEFQLNISKKLNKNEQIVLNIDSLCRIVIKSDIALNYLIPNLYNGEDMAIIPVWILNSKTYSVVSNCIYNYLCHKGSISDVKSDKALMSLDNSFKYIKEKLPKKYKKECEFLGIRNYLYGSLLGLYKFSNDSKKAKKIIDNFEKDFPTWENNKYISTLPFYKKIFLWFVKKRQLFFVKVMSKIHMYLR